MRLKSTGFRSENSHVWGHVRDIVSQLLMETPMMSPVLYAVLGMESGGLDDWPRIDGELKSWSEATGEDANLAILRCHYFADFYGMWLHEYFGSDVLKVYYGERKT